MYMMFVDMLNCTSSMLPWMLISYGISSICSDILYESSIIYEMQFPAELRDLLVEQGKTAIIILIGELLFATDIQ